MTQADMIGAQADIMGGTMTVVSITLLVVMCLVLLAIVVGLIWRRAPSTREARPEATGHAFPVITEPPEPPARAVQEIGTGPGRYRVNGVVRETGSDTRMYLVADSPANAKVKAELRGVIVTDIAKE